MSTIKWIILPTLLVALGAFATSSGAEETQAEKTSRATIKGPFGGNYAIVANGEKNGIVVREDVKDDTREILETILEKFPDLPDHSALLGVTVLLIDKLVAVGETYSGTEQARLGDVVTHAKPANYRVTDGGYCADFSYSQKSASSEKNLGLINYCLDKVEGGWKLAR